MIRFLNKWGIEGENLKRKKIVWNSEREETCDAWDWAKISEESLTKSTFIYVKVLTYIQSLMCYKRSLNIQSYVQLNIWQKDRKTWPLVYIIQSS